MDGRGVMDVGVLDLVNNGILKLKYRVGDGQIN